jgi:ribonuclease D
MAANQIIPVHYIENSQQLEGISSLLANFPYLSVDTESNSLYVYREQVCLLQISTPEADYLIDTLSVQDLSCLAPLFASSEQEKIFHAAEYDIICLKRDFNFTISNIFDTMVAARILGEPAVGLGSLLQSRLGITVEKKYQRANWGMRPLSTEMIEYARQDSQHLYDLKVLLEKDLKEKNLWDLALEDFRLGCEVNGHSQPTNSSMWWKVAGANDISASEAAILQSLCDFREEIAARRNVPPFKIISNEILVKLSQEPPASEQELVGMRGISPHFLQRYGQSLIQTIHTGRGAKPLSRPSKPRPDERFLRRLDALKEWRKTKGKEASVESDVVLPRDFVERIAAENPESMEKLHQLMARIPWRYQHYSKEIFSVLRKQEVV